MSGNRLQMDLSDEAHRRLRILTKATGSASYVETVRTALLIYEALLDQRDKGRTMFSVDTQGEAHEFPLVLGP